MLYVIFCSCFPFLVIWPDMSKKVKKKKNQLWRKEGSVHWGPQSLDLHHCKYLPTRELLSAAVALETLQIHHVSTLRINEQRKAIRIYILYTLWVHAFTTSAFPVFRFPDPFFADFFSVSLTQYMIVNCKSHVWLWKKNVGNWELGFILILPLDVFVCCSK